MLYLAILTLILSLVLFLRAQRTRKQAGIPGGKIIYADTSKWQPNETPLFSQKLKLSGKPDYLIQQKNRIIPVEVKSTRVSSGPYDSHIFQLASYCYLVEEHFGTAPPYGIIHYPNKTFQVPYTKELKEALLNIIIEMRRVEYQTNISRSHQEARRCQGCNYCQTCNQSLA